MSGLAGILNLDSAPVDRGLLDLLTKSMAFRGPDAQEVWCEGAVGLGHAMLRVTQRSETERQPAELDGCLRIVADARIDARGDLVRELNAKARPCSPVSPATPDSELILHAYQVWGEDCVDHLLGDFAFAIWDSEKRRLFCARDHFGIKPFYYAQVGQVFVFSNTLDTVRMHPAVSSRLNDLAIADFLLFDMNQDLATTSFADIRRLAPAHTLVCEGGQVFVRRYWELEASAPVRFRRDEEYVERFLELLDTAVSDRLRTTSASVLMSGGLDSTTVAASAQRIFKRNGITSGLRAYTEVFDRLIPHEERRYATLAANGIGIPIEFLVSDQRTIFERADQTEHRAPEPTSTAWPDGTSDLLCRAATRSRVALTGFGGDPAFCGRITIHFRELLGEKKYGQAIADTARYLSAEGRFSRLYISTRWQIVFAPHQRQFYPSWLNENLERQLGLKERWKAFSNFVVPVCKDAVRPEAHELIAASIWTNLFEYYDPGRTGMPVEVRHPFFDLRLLRFLLGLPRLPWCCDKELLREAAREILPERVRLRRKSPLAANLLDALLERPGSAWVDDFDPLPQLGRYVVHNRIPPLSHVKGLWVAEINLRPLSLNFWLRYTSQ